MEYVVLVFVASWGTTREYRLALELPWLEYIVIIQVEAVSCLADNISRCSLQRYAINLLIGQFICIIQEVISRLIIILSVLRLILRIVVSSLTIHLCWIQSTHNGHTLGQYECRATGVTLFAFRILIRIIVSTTNEYLEVGIGILLANSCSIRILIIAFSQVFLVVTQLDDIVERIRELGKRIGHRRSLQTVKRVVTCQQFVGIICIHILRLSHKQAGHVYCGFIHLEFHLGIQCSCTYFQILVGLGYQLIAFAKVALIVTTLVVSSSVVHSAYTS